jgi:hypothetical protein
MLHLPRTIAFPHSESDWLALFESLGFSGIAFIIADATRRHAATAPELAT